jgi:ATP-dependent RNA helicase RhlE
LQIDENVRAYARHLPLRVATVFGGVGEHPQINALRAGTTSYHRLSRSPDGFDAAPLRDFSQLQYLVLDEADRMLDMGFLPSIRQIVRALPRNGRRCSFPRRSPGD